MAKKVFVLGAGSNNDYGFPTSRQLKEHIHYSSAAAPTEEFSQEHIAEFQTKFWRSDYDSIDQYLEQFPEYLALGKYLMTSGLSEYEEMRHDALYEASDGSWYRLLYRAIRDGGLGPDDIEFITFNYDRSLEAFLAHRHCETEGIEFDKALHEMSLFSVNHLYGKLGDLEKYPIDKKRTGEELVEIAERDISIVSDSSEGVGRFHNAQFQQANTSVAEAEVVAFLGFGFSQENMSRFMFDWGKHPKRILITSNGLDAERAIAVLGRRDGVEFFGSCREAFEGCLESGAF